MFVVVVVDGDDNVGADVDGAVGVVVVGETCGADVVEPCGEPEAAAVCAIEGPAPDKGVAAAVDRLVARAATDRPEAAAMRADQLTDR